MFLLSGLRTKLSIARDRNCPRLSRAFAAIEMVCEPVSLFTIVGVAAFVILRGTDVWTPPHVVAAWIVRS